MGNDNDISFLVIFMFSLPVYGCDEISVSHIAKDTCDNSVIIQRNPLPLYTDCKSYSFEVLLNMNSKP